LLLARFGFLAVEWSMMRLALYALLFSWTRH